MAIRKRPENGLADRMRAVTAAQNRDAVRALTQASPGAARALRCRRRAQRSDKFKQALLIAVSGVRIKVVVTNISATGARVEFYSGSSEIFGRILLQEPSLGLKKWARVVWKEQNSAGLEFEDEHGPR